MDYKFLLLLIFIVGFIILIIWQLDTFRSMIERKIDSRLCDIDKNIGSAIKTINGRNDVNTDKIKAYNESCIEKIRRIEGLENQEIINASNNYEDSPQTKDTNSIVSNKHDTLSEYADSKGKPESIKQESLYYSDIPNTNKEHSIEHENYISERDSHSEKEDDDKYENVQSIKSKKHSSEYESQEQAKSLSQRHENSSEYKEHIVEHTTEYSTEKSYSNSEMEETSGKFSNSSDKNSDSLTSNDYSISQLKNLAISLGVPLKYKRDDISYEHDRSSLYKLVRDKEKKS